VDVARLADAVRSVKHNRLVAWRGPIATAAVTRQIPQRQPMVVEVDTMGPHRCEMIPVLGSRPGSIEGMNQGEYFESSVS